MTLKKYEKLQVIIDAMEWTGENSEEMYAWNDDFCIPNWGFSMIYRKKEIYAEIGDMIIKGVNGEFYPCDPDIFKKTYKEVG
jgi:hypothetical protein